MATTPSPAAPAPPLLTSKQRKARLAEHEAARLSLQRRALHDADGTVRNLLADFLPFARFDRNGLDAELSLVAPGTPAWTPELAAALLDLTRANMRGLYDRSRGWGWKEVTKRAELADPAGRYIIARARAPPGDADGAHHVGAILGFISFRFTLEGAHDALYIYELQLGTPAQRKGLGKHLMQVSELIARKVGMQLVMLTVLTCNAPALDFYTRKMRYVSHETSPSACGEAHAAHEILVKCVDPKGAAAADALAHELRGGR